MINIKKSLRMEQVNCDMCKENSVTFTYCVEKDCTHEQCGQILTSSCTHMFCTDCIRKHENFSCDDCFLCPLEPEWKNKSLSKQLMTPMAITSGTSR